MCIWKLQLCFLGRCCGILGASWLQGSYFGAILGPRLAILWVMLKLSRATVGHVEAICQMLLDLCPKVLSPKSTKILSGFWRAMLMDPFRVQMQGSKQRFGPRLGPSLAILGPARYLEATALLLEGKLGYREVMLKLSWAMLCHVEAICQTPSRTKILSGFLRAMLAPFGDQVRLFYVRVGAILWPTSAILGVLKAICPCCFGIVKNHPKIHLRNAPPPPPPALKARQNQIKTAPKHKNRPRR